MAMSGLTCTSSSASVRGLPRIRGTGALSCPVPQHRLQTAPGLSLRALQAPVRAQLSDEAITPAEAQSASKALAEVTKRIKKLGSTGRWREAVSELAGLSRIGLTPDLQAGTALVSACCRNMDVAQSVFDELFSDLLVPDEIVFAVLVRGYGAQSPPDWVKMDAVMTRMKNEYALEPSATIFNALLEVCVRTSDLERGSAVIDRMAEDGVQPDEFTMEVVAAKKVLRSYLRKTFG